MHTDPRPQSTHERHPQTDQERFAPTIGEALTGYAHDGGSWELGKWVFNDALEKGERLDDALQLALESIRENAESSPEEAARKFWSKLPVEEAIGEALTGYAHDGGSWELGKYSFEQSLQNEGYVQKALDAAFDVSADSAESSRQQASMRFWRKIHPSYVEKETNPLNGEVVDGVVLHELIHRPDFMGSDFAGGTYRGEKNGVAAIVKRGGQDLRDEKEILSQIDYKGIPKVLSYVEDIGVYGGVQLAMEEMPGSSFKEFVGLAQWENEPVAPKAAASIAAGITRCFEAVSRAGYLYRDLNPGHVLIEKKEGKYGPYEVALVDVGASVKKQGDGKAALTEWATAHRGTWETMAPEEFEDNAVLDETSGVYSIGCMLYQMVAGKSPFRLPEGASADSDARRTLVHEMHLESVKAPIEGELGKIIEKALNPDPTKRYSSLKSFKDALLTVVRE